MGRKRLVDATCDRGAFSATCDRYAALARPRVLHPEPPPRRILVVDVVLEALLHEPVLAEPSQLGARERPR